MSTKEFQLNAIFIQDPSSGGFTSFFAEIPEVMAQGETQNEAMENLMIIMKAAMSDKGSEFQNNTPCHANFTSKPVKFQLTV